MVAGGCLQLLGVSYCNKNLLVIALGASRLPKSTAVCMEAADLSANYLPKRSNNGEEHDVNCATSKLTLKLLICAGRSSIVLHFFKFDYSSESKGAGFVQ